MILKLSNYKNLNVNCKVSDRASKAIPADIDAIFSNCTRNTGVDINTLRTAFTQNFNNASRDVQCFFDCVLRSRKWINGDSINETAIQQDSIQRSPIGDTSRITNAIRTCKSSYTGKDNCEKSFKFDECLRKNSNINLGRPPQNGNLGQPPFQQNGNFVRRNTEFNKINYDRSNVDQKQIRSYRSVDIDTDNQMINNLDRFVRSAIDNAKEKVVEAVRTTKSPNGPTARPVGRMNYKYGDNKNTIRNKMNVRNKGDLNTSPF